MPSPLGKKTLASMPVPLEHFTAHFDPGYERLEGSQRRGTARYLFTPPPERLVQLRGVNPVQSDYARFIGEARVMPFPRVSWGVKTNLRLFLGAPPGEIADARLRRGNNQQPAW